MDLYGYGQSARETARTLPGRAGAAVRRFPRTLAEAAMAPFEPARALGAGLAEGAEEFGAGIAGLPSREEMERQIGQTFKAPTSIGEALALKAVAPQAEPDFGDVLSGASGGGIAAVLERQARAPRFEDVEGGGSSTDPRAHTLSEAPREQPGRISYNLGDGWQDYGEHDRAPLAPGAGRAFDPIDNRSESYRPAAGGGTVSMMTAPENEQRVTIASAIEDAANESTLREARGEPSLAQIFAAEQANRRAFGPKEELEYSRAEATNKELQALNVLSHRLQQAVAAGQLSSEMADAQFEKERQSAAFRLQALQGDTLAAWGPQRNPYEMGAAPIPGQG